MLPVGVHVIHAAACTMSQQHRRPTIRKPRLGLQLGCCCAPRPHLTWLALEASKGGPPNRNS
jgi:hypothetical protein